MDIKLIRTALGLLNSMVLSGEEHSEQSKKIVDEALFEARYEDTSRWARIATGTQEEGKAQMVFAILFAVDGKPYAKYTHVDEETQIKDIPVVMLQMRWDGYLGFPGGKVDPGEDLLTAIQREVGEEINAYIPKEDFTPFTTFAGDESNIHSFVVKLPYDMLKHYHKHSSDSEHFLAENCGCILPHIANYSKARGVNQLLDNNFIATAKLELEAFIKEVLMMEV